MHWWISSSSVTSSSLSSACGRKCRSFRLINGPEPFPRAIKRKKCSCERDKQKDKCKNYVSTSSSIILSCFVSGSIAAQVDKIITSINQQAHNLKKRLMLLSFPSCREDKIEKKNWKCDLTRRSTFKWGSHEANKPELCDLLWMWHFKCLFSSPIISYSILKRKW